MGFKAIEIACTMDVLYLWISEIYTANEMS